MLIYPAAVVAILRIAVVESCALGAGLLRSISELFDESPDPERESRKATHP